MTITSVNHNPKNESKYARRRSVWKGRHNQLRDTVAQLNGTSGITVFEYFADPLIIKAGLMTDWGFSFVAVREGAKGFRPFGRWDIAPPPPRLLQAVPGGLRADLKLLWNDFVLAGARRIGESSGAGADSNWNGLGYNGTSLVVLAFGPSSFDLIVSKYGYGDDQNHNHHFFQWQARIQGFQGLVNVDDYEVEGEGLTLYVAG